MKHTAPAVFALLCSALTVAGSATCRAQSAAPSLEHRPPAATNAAAVKAAVLHLPPGTKLMVRLSQPLDPRNAIVGQSWEGTLVNDIPVGNRVGVPAGTAVDGLIIAVKRSGHVRDNGSLSLQLLRVDDAAVATDVLTRDASGHIKSSVAKVGGGAAAGAGLGAIAGGALGAAVGGAVGAGTGALVAARGETKPPAVPTEDTLTFTVK